MNAADESVFAIDILQPLNDENVDHSTLQMAGECVSVRRRIESSLLVFEGLAPADQKAQTMRAHESVCFSQLAPHPAWVLAS